MKYVYLTLLIAVSIFPATVFSQTVADFENLGLVEGEFLNGDDLSGGWKSGNCFLPNSYNEAYASFLGWAISATTDTVTPGFTNQYSSITGRGFDGSTTFATTYMPFGNTIRLTDDAIGGVVEGLYLTNSTYAYRSILEGDAFSKRFGGVTGDDPDFFLLTIKKYLDGNLSTDSVNFYLADYRFEDNSQDYVVNDWHWLDLSSLGNCDSLHFQLTSSDVGMFGMNTPAYVCIDNITTRDATVSVDRPKAIALQVFPNPTVDIIQFDWDDDEADLLITDMSGREIHSQRVVRGRNTLSIGQFANGIYIAQISSEGVTHLARILKN